MPGRLKGIAVGSLLLLPLGCDWEEFHACEGEECATTSLEGAGGTSGPGGTGGVTSGGITSGGITSGGSGSGGGSGGGADGGAAGTGIPASGGTSGTAGSTAGGDGGSSGTGGGAGEGGSPSQCDGELLPADDACVVNEEYGVFVSPGGDDENGDGTRDAPYATLQKAANRAGELGKRVYACATAGDYAARLSLAEPHDGLELFGSFDCGDWGYASELSAQVVPEAGVPLQIRDIPTSLELEGFTLESADATTRGTSSIAAEIRTSSGVVLRRVVLRAGAGADGALGEAADFAYPDPSLLDGVDGEDNEGGRMEPVECPAGDITRGGDGGGPDATDLSEDGIPDHEGSGGDGGVLGGSCEGQDGENGPDGLEGAGATTRGGLIDGSWTPAGGSPGGHGLPGQGGGGGAGAPTGGGGSGGAGGCGSPGGTGGGGGGASIALVLLDAEVSLLDSEVVAGDGGLGAPGGLGQRPTSDFGSPGQGRGGGCAGGFGGLGGAGGGGGGGAGGISVGILFQGTAPVRTRTSLIAGIEGDGGQGAGVDNDGVDGFAEPQFDLADL